MTTNDTGIDREFDIGEVARLTGVTTRALRHYDAIGLLPPTAVRADGRRFYGRAELLRLQRILILRELDVPLEQIAAICDETVDEVAALRAHRIALLARADELTAVIATVDRTLDHLTTGAAMTIQDVFDGIPGYDSGAQRENETEARERWGNEAVDASHQRTADLTADDAAQVMADHDEIARELARLHSRGERVDSDAAQALVARHHRWVSTFWTPSAEAYVGLAAMYVDDERFRRNYDIHGEGTAQFLRNAIEIYAANELD